jgi:hypothetical protein
MRKLILALTIGPPVIFGLLSAYARRQLTMGDCYAALDAPWDDKRVCAECGHNRVHHYGATDGLTPPQPIAGCMVWIGSPKDKGVSRKGSCGCRTWVGDKAEAASLDRDELRKALKTIEAMGNDAADLIEAYDEMAAMRTVLAHLLNDRGAIHDSGCGICDAGRALLSAGDKAEAPLTTGETNA